MTMPPKNIHARSSPSQTASHLAEIDLRLLRRRRIVDAHRRRLLAPRELVVREAPQRVVARAQVVVAHEQRVDLREAQRARLGVTGEPTLDALAMHRDLLPLVARRCERPRLNALRDLVDLAVGDLATALEAERRRRRRVPRDRLAVDAGLAADLPIAVPRRPAAKHFLHVDHV
jgi:hypothetical protein